MARKPGSRPRGYVVVTPNKAIIPTRPPVGPYPGQGTPTPTPSASPSFGALTAAFGSTTYTFGLTA